MMTHLGKDFSSQSAFGLLLGLLDKIRLTRLLLFFHFKCDDVIKEQLKVALVEKYYYDLILFNMSKHFTEAALFSKVKLNWPH